MSGAEANLRCSAYIAASRRSDRSLEARVESARRASEIHKRRTGRSLRVTEQDVVNEEMYEEEDDDLPMQYRRLTAHLQTGSSDFNRRLSAYLTNHVAMRTALDQAITNSYAQQYPNAPQFAHNQQSMYPSPFMAHNMQQQQSPQSYMPSPYMAPATSNFQSRHHMRSASAAGVPEASGYSQTPATSSPIENPASVDHRRTSMPNKLQSKSVSPVTSRTPQPLQSRPTMPQRSSSNGGSHSSPSLNAKQEGQVKQDAQVKPEGQPLRQMQAPPQLQQYPQYQQPAFNAYPYRDFGPLTTALPTESQMLLGPAFDPNDPLTSMFMAGSENMFYNPPMASMSKQRNFHPSYDGMNATLAPSALDMSTGHGTFNPAPPNTPAMSMSMSKPGFQLAFDGSMHNFAKEPVYNGGTSSGGSGAATPGIDGSWDAFINDNTWAENAT